MVSAPDTVRGSNLERLENCTAAVAALAALPTATFRHVRALSFRLRPPPHRSPSLCVAQRHLFTYSLFPTVHTGYTCYLYRRQPEPPARNLLSKAQGSFVLTSATWIHTS